MYCKFVLSKGMMGILIVLIVAKCIVNENINLKIKSTFSSINSSKVYCKFNKKNN